MSYSNLFCNWLLFPSFACPLARFPRTVAFRGDRPGVCFSLEKLPKTISCSRLKAPGKFGPVKSLVILPQKVTGAHMLAKTFSGNLLAIKWQLLEHFFFYGLFSEKIKWSIDRVRDKMIEQNTDRKFSESFTRMHARGNTMIDASLFVFAKSSPTAILVYENNSSYNAVLLEYYKECRHMAERSADESVFFDLLLDPNR